MKEEDKILEFQKEVLNAVVPFDKLPEDVRKSTFEYIAFRRELAKESDRGCALLAAAHLDYMLEALLKRVLIGDKKHHELLFGFNGPLGTFSSRILLSFSIGVISSNALHDIQIIRKIRNEFGHTPSIIDFENQRIKGQCNKLKLNVKNKDTSARHKFLNAVSALSGQLEALTIKSEPFKEASELDLQSRKENFEKIMSLIRDAAKNTSTKSQ